MIVHIVACMINPIFFPFYALYYWLHRMNINYQHFSNLECLIAILWIWTLFAYIGCIYCVFKYAIPIHLMHYLILPTSKINFDSIKQVLNDCDESEINTLFESIELHYLALSERPSKEIIVYECFGKDIGNIVMQFVPVQDGKQCLLDQYYDSAKSER